MCDKEHMHAYYYIYILYIYMCTFSSLHDVHAGAYATLYTFIYILLTCNVCLHT